MTTPTAPTTPRYRATLLRAGEFRLDGGSMFGLIPRSVWTRACTPDDKGRIPVQHNCLLLERLDDPAPDGSSRSTPHAARSTSYPGGTPKLILIETGTGNKLDLKNRDIFALSERSILDALHEVNARPEDIGLVTATHLHFDHAGGMTRLCTPGETPDWTGSASTFGGSRGDHSVKLTFPNAPIIVQAREWSDARAGRSVMTRTYFPDHLEPLASRIVQVDSPRPFVTGATPDRGEMPNLSLEQRCTEIAPGLFSFLVPGHTWGQQAFLFTDAKGRTIVFTPDVMPTAWHNGLAYSLAYDVEPYTSMISRQWFLSEAADRGWLIVLDHEPGNPVRRVVRNDKGWFDLPEESL
jgi:glyoxylase-like metal-dependent hydrolase (beta-lactamase superfamily II)